MNSRLAQFGLLLNVPIYTGGFVNSRVRETISLQDKSRADLEAAHRFAVTNAQDGFSGVNSAVAGVKAFEQAVASAEVALQSNILGQEVGIRTNLDVLNVQQNVFSTRRDLANAYFAYMLAVLRLKSAVGTLNERTWKTSIAAERLNDAAASRVGFLGHSRRTPTLLSQPAERAAIGVSSSLSRNRRRAVEQWRAAYG